MNVPPLIFYIFYSKNLKKRATLDVKVNVCNTVVDFIYNPDNRKCRPENLYNLKVITRNNTANQS